MMPRVMFITVNSFGIPERAFEHRVDGFDARVLVLQTPMSARARPAAEHIARRYRGLNAR